MIMETFTVSFFGHKIIPDLRLAESKLMPLIHTLLLEKEFVEFLVGRDGDFDQIVSSTIRHEKRVFRNDNSALVWVLPYPTAELRNNIEDFQKYYDEIEVCDKSALSYPKRAFQVRNRQMVNRSDLVVFYVNRHNGGAYQTLRYAKSLKKVILNLGENDISTQ